MERNLRYLDLLFLSICNMVGIGIFKTAHYVLIHTGSCIWSVALIVASGAIATMFGLCYAELGSTYPYAGGDINYLKRAYSNYVGTAYSLTSIAWILPLSCAVMAVTIHECFKDIVRKNIFIAVILVIVSMMLSFGGRLVTWTVRILFFLKIATVALLVIISASSFFKTREISNPAILDPRNAKADMNALGALKGLCFTQFSFDGWNNGNYIANRVQNPGKAFPRAILGSIWATAAIYVLTTLSAMFVVPYTEIISNGMFIEEYFRIMNIPIPSRMLSVIVTLIPTIGSLMCSLIVSSGIMESLLPVKFSKKLEVLSLLLFSLVVFLFSMFKDIHGLISRIAFGTSFFYSLSCIGLVVLKIRQPCEERPFNLPLAVPVLASILGMIVCGFIVVYS
ncbi:L-type amino acid transporter [Ordospora colligata]|uniref:L-type amino acid transporter n=1 Tax=Ordospora colligata OC4 TaxID=1354746 RepID=A0A0B2UEG0_9MICR|nr:L-type amino acid transporter [Ordospora colligata OC4]KHN69486.1 L-type amino acid transporter [Ordospora colligata OC4]TBU15230.1 L-type amino acid transporter [Ordospora colligata]TBU15301.1 L-type amino acid transporter [Ordospora colligata]TBU18483.1 L-type amino acid transporter [Ordospora colligata]